MIRLILVIIFLLISLLAIFKAYTYHLWLLSIGVAEFAWIFSAITLVLLLTGLLGGRYQMTGTVVGILALILYLSPIIRAWSAGRQLPAALDDTFGKDPAAAKPFSFATMLTGYHQQKISSRI